jgi:hypothetical protein
MTMDERRVITNGIWLCRSCAALVDRDENRYSVETLYKWKRDHEAEQLALIRGPADVVDERQHATRLFKDESPAALQLVIDQPEHWKYLLTAELAREKLRRIRRQIAELHDRVVYVPTKVVALQELPRWLKERTADLHSIMYVLEKIVVHRLGVAWAQDDADEILRTTNLLSDACKGLLRWEEQVVGALFPDGFEDMRPSMQGWTSEFLSAMEGIPAEISRVIGAGVRGEYTIKVPFVIPESFDAFTAELRRRTEKFEAGLI